MSRYDSTLVDDLTKHLFQEKGKPFSGNYNNAKLYYSELEKSLINITFLSGMDLAALNIQRGRDHGLPGYTKYRKLCNRNEKKIENFNDLAQVLGKEKADILARLYR